MTGTITGTAPDSDASIELGANFVVNVGTVETLRSGASYFRCSSAAGNYFYAEQTGNYQSIWIGGKGGSGGSGNVGIQTAKVTGTDTEGRSMTIAAGASTGAGLPGELVFATSDVGASGSTENTLTTRLKIDEQNRVLINQPVAPEGTPENVLFVNGLAIANIGVETPSLTGPLEGDASIVLGDQVTLKSSEGETYEPVYNDSLVTKGWVESQRPPVPPAQVASDWDEVDPSDKAFIRNKPTSLSEFTNDLDFSNEIEYGTPSSSTAPDSPSGSTLYDNLNLYVKGTTSWRKTGLYSLDSTGGGSQFPLPQPGQDAGDVWESKAILGDGDYGTKNSITVAGNAFWMQNFWSLDGTDWYSVIWNNVNYGPDVTNDRSTTVSYGNNVFCGCWGFSYDGRNWTTYSKVAGNNANVTAHAPFFYQGNHYDQGGARWFDGENWISTGAAGSSMNLWNDGTYVIPCLNSCVGIAKSQYAPYDGTLQVYQAGADMMDGASLWNLATGVPQNIDCIARDYRTDLCIGLTNTHAYIQKSPGSLDFRKVDLPVSADWGGIAYDGEAYVAIASGQNANISIKSVDGGNTWTTSTSLVNPGIVSVAAFNGRAVGCSPTPEKLGNTARIISTLVSGNPVPDELNTANIALTNPVDPNVYRDEEAAPVAMLLNQEDANGYFAEQVAVNSDIAMNAASTAILAIGKATQNEGAIAGNTVAIESNSHEIAKNTANITPIVTLTQAAYDALADIDPDTIYMITPV